MNPPALSPTQALARRTPSAWPLWLLAALPKHLLSRLAGRFARQRWPRGLQARLNRGYVRLFGVDAGEAELPVEQYPSIQALFTRRLRPGLRPLAEDPAAIVAPVDGAWGEAGAAPAGRAVQVKGRDYSVEQLLGGGERARAYVGGQVAVFYLSPRDYHRIHTPLAGRLVGARYLPGRLWPVNTRAVQHIDELFARNERLVTFLATPRGEIALVAVGATMVGRTVVLYDDLTTNPPRRELTERVYQGPDYARGEEIGRFEFGSTVVVVLPPGLGTFTVQPPGTPLRLGEAVGRLGDAAEAG